MKIDIYGSCVCRDIFRQTGAEKYEIVRCISGVPITTLYSDPVPISDESLDALSISDYEKRMLKVQLKKNAVDILKNSKSKILVLDLAEEFMKRGQIGDDKRYDISYYEENEEEFAKLLVNGDSSTISIDLELIDQKIKQFAKDIVYSADNPGGYPEKNICVIESYYAEKIAGNDGVLHGYNAKYQVKEKNEWLKKIYAILYKYIQECRIIKLPLFTHSSENHIRGTHPLDYTAETYEYFLNAFNVLCGIEKTNSIENLYKERSLNNKLATRLFNSTAIYSIGGIEKKIKSMQKEIQGLKKEIARLKKK